VRTPDRKLTAVAVTAALIGFATVPAFATAPAFADIVPPLPLPSSASPAPPAPPAVPPVPAPAVPKAPALPAVPALPKLPALPQVPALPKLPVAPQLPKLPAAAIPKVLPPAQAPAKPAAPGVGQLGGLPFGSFHDHVPAVALQQFGPPAPGGQHLGPDMPYDQTGHNTTAKGVDVTPPPVPTKPRCSTRGPAAAAPCRGCSPSPWRWVVAPPPSWCTGVVGRAPSGLDSPAPDRSCAVYALARSPPL